MKPTTIKLTLAGLIGAALISGCAGETPRLDEHFGDAVNAAKAQQIVDPNAALNRDPVAGVDGQAANSAVDRYHRSFQTPTPPANVFTIGVGTSGGAMAPAAGGAR